MPDDTRQWRIEIRVDAGAVEAFGAALDSFCDAVSWFEEESSGEWRISGYTIREPDRQALARALEETAQAVGTGVPDAAVEVVVPRDWVAENQASFAPITAGRYFICNDSFDGPLPAGKRVFRINPGAAFGSGRHATTWGCLLALDGLARGYRFRRILDMGCGSGILAMAAAATWNAPAVASDIDAKAVAVAAVNVRKNGLAALIETAVGDGYLTPQVCRHAPYDLVICNILAGPLRRMARDLGRCLAPEGHAVLAGFLERHANRVLAAHRAQGLSLVRRITVDGWTTLVLRRSRG